MERHELEARLKQVREQIAAMEAGTKRALKSNAEKRNERNARRKAQLRALEEADQRQRETLWGRVKLFFGFRDGPNGPEDDVNGDSIDLLFDTMKAATILPLGLKKLNELKREEGRILDQLESLGVKRELTKAEQRDKIFEEMANRKAEWERIRQRETDQEQLRRLKNIYDDADARDEDRLRKLL